MTIIRNALFCLFAIIVVAFCTTLASGANDCGGLKGGGATQSKEWAHCVRLDPTKSQGITIEPTKWIDNDAHNGACTSVNYWNKAATVYAPQSGTCTPTTGASTVWKPSVRGDSINVWVTVKDYSAPFDDDDVTFSVPVNAFEVKIDVVITAPDGTARNGSRWEYDTSPSLQFTEAPLPRNVQARKWGTTTNYSASDNGTIGIDFWFRTVPDQADTYGGMISAYLDTAQKATLETNVEDIDVPDSTTQISPSLSAPWGLGVSINWGITIASDCTEAFASSAVGYFSNGLGTERPPTVAAAYVGRTSAVEADPIPYNYQCYVIGWPYPYSWDEEYHWQSKSVPYSASGTLMKPKEQSVRAEWTAFTYVAIDGPKTGANAQARVSSWEVTASVSNVVFVP
ncbi:MAG: hypothetical protein U0836_06170 [Pirellulales bacterium]